MGTHKKYCHWIFNVMLSLFRKVNNFSDSKVCVCCKLDFIITIVLFSKCIIYSWSTDYKLIKDCYLIEVLNAINNYSLIQCYIYMQICPDGPM